MWELLKDFTPKNPKRFIQLSFPPLIIVWSLFLWRNVLAKELPYFRFYVSEWLNDDISFLPYNVKGVFADVCSLYWFKDCSITKAMLEQRLNDAKDELEQLYSMGIIKLDDDMQEIRINFLDEQYDVLSDKRKKRVEAGRKGGLRKSSNAKAMLKQSSSYKDKDKDKEKDNNSAYTFDSFWNDYDKKKDRKKCEAKYKKVTEKDRELIKQFIPIYKGYEPDSQFRKNPYTFLNAETWLDEWSEYSSKKEGQNVNGYTGPKIGLF
jgi:hypothetical protein